METTFTKSIMEPLTTDKFIVYFPERWNIPNKCITSFYYSFDGKFIDIDVVEGEGEQIMESICRLFELGLARNGDEITCEIFAVDGKLASRRVYGVNQLISIQENGLNYNINEPLRFQLRFSASIVSVEDFPK